MKRQNPRLLLSLFPLTTTISCANFEFANSKDERGDSNDTASYLPDGAEGLAFRLDILASQSIDDSLLDETFFISEGEGENMLLELSPQAVVSGIMSGFDVNPTADITLPGQVGGVSGVVRAWVPNTVMNYSTRVLDDGIYELPIVPHEKYLFSWTPSHGVALPFYVDEGVVVSGDLERNVLLSWDESIPIYGAVSGTDDQPLEDVRIQIYDSFTGAIGPSVDTSDIGTYNLRLYPGSYDLEISGKGDEGVPTFTQHLQVGETDEAIDTVTNQLSEAQAINADGRVVTPLGVPASGVLVRFTALSVFGLGDVELTSESTTGSNGRFSIPVLQGVYQVEFIPSQDEGFSPQLIREISLEGDVTEIGTVNLVAREQISGQVLDALGQPAEGVILRAEEIGFNNVVYQTVTNQDGTFEIEVSDTELFWTLIPTDSTQGAITFGEGTPANWDGMIVQLKTGQPISGCIVHEDGVAAFAPLELRNMEGRFFGGSFTDENGCFDLRIDIETQSSDSREESLQ
jgi:hypothetical protein